MFVTKLALEISEQNFVTKLNHNQDLNWGLYYTSVPNGLPPARSQGLYRPKSGGRYTIEYEKVVHDAAFRKG